MTAGLGVRARVVWSIFAKEARETLRDRRTLFLLIAVPLIFYPLLMVVVTEVAVSQRAQIEMESGAVMLVGELPRALEDRLASDGSLVLTRAPDPDGALREGRVQLVLEASPGLEGALGAGEQARLSVRYDSIEPLSEEVLERVQGHLSAWEEQVRAERLEAKGLSAQFVDPVVWEAKDAAPQERQVGGLLSQFLPMLVLVFMVTGAFYPAIDLTAGEKERKTIQTLLTSPVRPLEVVAGKYLTVFAVAMISGLINIASVGLLVAHQVTLAKGTGQLPPVSVSPLDLLAALWVIVWMGGLMSALMTTIATLADSPKDAQSYLSPVYMLSLAPVMVAQLPGVELSAATAFVPILNLALALKQILTEGAQAEGLFLVTASSATWTGLILLLAARLWQREELLIEKGGARALLSFSRAGLPNGGVATPGAALSLVSAMFLLLYYIGSALQQWDLLGGVAITLSALLLAPTLLAIRALNLDPRAVLHLRRPSPRAMLGAALLGLSSFIWVGAAVRWLHARFLPIPPEYEELLNKMFTPPEGLGGQALLVLVVALMPAICEEAVFRGWLLSSLRAKMSGPWAVALSALLFGLFHLSVYRLLGTTALGVIMGALVWRSGSIWTSALYHFLNNAGSLLLVDALKAAGVEVQHDELPLWLLLSSLALSALGAWLAFFGAHAPSATIAATPRPDLPAALHS
jgi:sodium transport system permease protein